ncbi:MAG: hypothetical protein F4Y44_11455 [Chloroflexi bacterium]|nr:hypothetical protein [Chloroflexota bacterium]
MCIQTAIQNKIAQLTNNGEDIAAFLVGVLRGKDAAVKICHRLDAARLLTKYGIPQPADTNIVVDRAGESENDTQNPSARSRPTLRDIAAYPVARYIRERTDNGEALINTLRYIMDGGHYNPNPFTGVLMPTVKPHERIAAAKELLRRSMGEYSHPRRNQTTYDANAELDANDPVNSAIVKLARERTDNGIEAAETLIQVIDSDPRDGEWRSGHRLAAAKELLHRAYDLNYDAVTWQDFENYYRASEEYNEVYELRQERRSAELSAILKEYNEAHTAGGEEAAATIEEKYYAYLRAEKGEEEAEYAEHGPSNPESIPYMPTRPPERKKSRRHAAADIRAAKLTIPLHNRSP